MEPPLEVEAAELRRIIDGRLAAADYEELTGPEEWDKTTERLLRLNERRGTPTRAGEPEGEDGLEELAGRTVLLYDDTQEEYHLADYHEFLLEVPNPTSPDLGAEVDMMDGDDEVPGRVVEVRGDWLLIEAEVHDGKIQTLMLAERA